MTPDSSPIAAESNRADVAWILGVCPALAFATTLLGGLLLGLVTLLSMCGTNLVFSTTLSRASQGLRITAGLVVIAAWVTLAGLVGRALAFDLYVLVGTLLPVIITNCMIIGRAEEAVAMPVQAALVAGLKSGSGVVALLTVVGALREYSDGLPLATAPTGALLALALILVARNLLTARRRRHAGAPA